MNALYRIKENYIRHITRQHKQEENGMKYLCLDRKKSHPPRSLSRKHPFDTDKSD